MNEVSVPDNRLYANMTEEQQAIVRMWFALGLNIELRFHYTANWISIRPIPGQAPNNLYYRLKP